MTVSPITRTAAMVSVGAALLVLAFWVFAFFAKKPSEGLPQMAEQSLPIIAERPRPTLRGSDVKSFRTEIRRDAWKGWQTVSGDVSWENLERIATYLAKWIDEDPESAIKAFGAFAREHPDLIGDIAVFCGNQWPGPKWPEVEAHAKRILDGFNLKAFMLIVARGASFSKPDQALLMLDALGDPEVGDLYSAQINVRGQIIDSCVKHDFKFTLDWLEKHRSWGREWTSFCRAVAQTGIDRVPIDDLSRVLSKVPLPNGAALGELLGPDSRGNKASALKLLKALDLSEPPEDKEQWRAGFVSVLAERAPEIFDSSYFNADNASDAVAVGMTRKGSFKDSLEWAETLRTTGAEAQAIQGIVYQMMHANSYMGSREIGDLDDASPQKSIAISTMIEWLRSRGKTREAEIWQRHLDGLK